MKFKFIGQSGTKDLDLAIYGIKSPSDILLNGEIIEIPDDNKDLIQRITINGNYEEYKELKKFKKPQKDKEKKEDK